jgi:hypothetical protein
MNIFLAFNISSSLGDSLKNTWFLNALLHLYRRCYLKCYIFFFRKKAKAKFRNQGNRTRFLLKMAASKRGASVLGRLPDAFPVPPESARARASRATARRTCVFRAPVVVEMDALDRVV